jgi:hypothetical protein
MPEPIFTPMRSALPSVVPGLDPRRQSVVDEHIHVARFLRRQVRRDVEVLDLARDAAGEGRRLKARDGADAGLARNQVLPGDLYGVADRADDAEPGDGDSTA